MTFIGRASLCFIVAQSVIILAFGLFTNFETYGKELPNVAGHNEKMQLFNRDVYPMFQDVHIMIFLGYGFIMVFLKSHNWSSIGFNFLTASWVI